MAVYRGTNGDNFFQYTGSQPISMYGLGGNDALYASVNNDRVFGGDGNDYLNGGNGNDLLNGGTGDDTLDGGTGTDTLYGGTGNDAYVVDSASDVIVENASEGNDTVYASVSYALGATYVENLVLTGTAYAGYGNSLNNYIAGNNSNNLLYGDAGDDTLDGGTGTDTLYGGTGNDAYVVDSASDVIVENASEGNDTVYASVSYALGATYVENLVLTGTAYAGYGNSLNNYIAGNNSNNLLYGDAGDDTLDGGLGNDTLYGGTGNDIYFVDSANDAIVENANEGNDTVAASVTYSLGTTYLENLVLTGTAYAGYGNSLNNYIAGNDASNYLDGYTGNDSLDGGAGNDTLIGGSGNDVLSGGSGNDEINGYGTSISTDSQYDTLAGGAGVDLFVLGGSWGVSYQGNGYATITDWDATSDFIGIHGNINQYSIEYNYVAGTKNLPDTEIFYNNNLIAVVQDTTNVSFSRDFVSV